MISKCKRCKGRGMIQRDGHGTPTGKPYDIVCGNCNGRGYAEERYNAAKN